MAEEPDQIRDDIEVTRDRLARDVDRLADKTSPSRVVQRRWGGAKAQMRGLSDRVMGSAHDNGSTAKDKASDAVVAVLRRDGHRHARRHRRSGTRRIPQRSQHVEAHAVAGHDPAHGFIAWVIVAPRRGRPKQRLGFVNRQTAGGRIFRFEHQLIVHQ